MPNDTIVTPTLRCQTYDFESEFILNDWNDLATGDFSKQRF